MDELNSIKSTYNLYDAINTQAARWVVWNFKDKKKAVGISHFNRKDKSHLWLLHIMNTCKVAQIYKYFYIECSWFNYLITRYIKGFKYVRRARGDVFLIEPEVFIDEVCKYYGADISIIEKIYDEYWSN